MRRLPADAAAGCLFVRNLNDSGPGSFREAVAARGPRINVFQVGGMLTLQSPIRITEPFVTIADQTAPGTGICFHGSEVSVPTISCSSAGTRGMAASYGLLSPGPSKLRRFAPPPRKTRCATSWLAPAARFHGAMRSTKDLRAKCASAAAGSSIRNAMLAGGPNTPAPTRPLIPMLMESPTHGKSPMD